LVYEYNVPLMQIYSIKLVILVSVEWLVTADATDEIMPKSRANEP